MKYYVNDETGAYIGGQSDEMDPPADSVEVPTPPEYADQIWDLENEEWLPHIPHSIEEECDIISGGLLVLEHGLTYTPLHVTFILINQTADLGYSPGDTLLIRAGTVSGKNGIGPAMAILADATYLRVRFASCSPVFEACRWDTGAQENLDNSKWKIRFFAT